MIGIFRSSFPLSFSLVPVTSLCLLLTLTPVACDVPHLLGGHRFPIAAPNGLAFWFRPFLPSPPLRQRPLLHSG